MYNLTAKRNQRPRTTWDLFREVDEMFNQMQSGSLPTASFGDEENVFRPATDIRENDKGYLMAFDLPGLSEKDVKIEVKDGALTVSGERKREQTTENDGWTRTERSFGRFVRSFSLPTDVDPAKIEAQVENGELHLFLPKGDAARPMAIPVRTRNHEGGEIKGLMERFFGSKDVSHKSDESKKH